MYEFVEILASKLEPFSKSLFMLEILLTCCSSEHGTNYQKLLYL